MTKTIKHSVVAAHELSEHAAVLCLSSTCVTWPVGRALMPTESSRTAPVSCWSLPKSWRVGRRCSK